MTFNEQFKIALSRANSNQRDALRFWKEAWYLAWECVKEDNNLTPLSQLLDAVRKFPALRATALTKAVDMLSNGDIVFNTETKAYNLKGKKHRIGFDITEIIEQVRALGWWDISPKEVVQVVFDPKKEIAALMRKLNKNLVSNPTTFSAEDKEATKLMMEIATSMYGNEILETKSK